MAPPPPRNGNGFAQKILIIVFGVALTAQLGLSTFLVTSQYRIDAQGEANKKSIERIDATLAATATAAIAAATAERDALRAQVVGLQQRPRLDDANRLGSAVAEPNRRRQVPGQ